MKHEAALSREVAKVRRIPIRAGGVTYEAIVGPGSLERLGAEAAQVVRGPHCAVVADANTAGLFGETALRSLVAAGFEPELIMLPPGENSKSLKQLGTVCDAMTGARLDRSSFVVALGGGVVGDLAGFAAAIFHRGIPHIQVPTTLLAQVDSSIGGKTAVNTATGKNLLGAVHQPALVIADVDLLRTLPPRELRQGFAEIIKHAIIADASLLDVLREGSALDMVALVSRNVEIKAAVVALDEHDALGQRAVLNFGHTVGHAIERTGRYQHFLHGEAISLGIVAACEISVRKARLPEAERQRVIDTLAVFELPTRLPADGFPEEPILTALAADKKFERGAVRFVVTPRLGTAHLADNITLADIKGALTALR